MANNSDFSIFVKNNTVPNGAVVTIQEGSGDNLTADDRNEGYVDYINYSVYTFENNQFRLYDGGMVLLTELYQNMEMDKIMNEVINMAFISAGKTEIIARLPDAANTEYFEDIQDTDIDTNDAVIKDILTAMGL